MKVTALTDRLVPLFIDYYCRYSPEQDESFPPHDDYTARADEPVYMLVGERGNISGAAALMLHKEYTEAKTGKFRIFHCIRKNAADYGLLLAEILKHTKGLNNIYCFIQEKQTSVRRAWESLGFRIKRYSWVLKRKTDDFQPPVFPGGYEIKTFRAGKDEQVWCDIINESFADMQGHIQMYPSKIDQWRREQSFLGDGMKILWHNNKPVGTMALTKDFVNGEEVIFIAAVGVLNSFQGRGLGRNMLRAGIEYGKNFGIRYVMLSVNAENERAADLYINEGFKKETLIICYSLEIMK